MGTMWGFGGVHRAHIAARQRIDCRFPAQLAHISVYDVYVKFVVVLVCKAHPWPSQCEDQNMN